VSPVICVSQPSRRRETQLPKHLEVQVWPTERVGLRARRPCGRWSAIRRSGDGLSLRPRNRMRFRFNLQRNQKVAALSAASMRPRANLTLRRLTRIAPSRSRRYRPRPSKPRVMQDSMTIEPHRRRRDHQRRRRTSASSGPDALEVLPGSPRRQSPLERGAAAQHVAAAWGHRCNLLFTIASAKRNVP
jgi:hypothetical protein